MLFSIQPNIELHVRITAINTTFVMSSSVCSWSPTSKSSSKWDLEASNLYETPRENYQLEDLRYSNVLPPLRPPLDEDKFVDWTGPDDPHNPFNWRTSKKWRVTLLACFMTFVVEINGTAMTSAAEQINESFRISDEHFPHSYWPVLSWNLGGAAAPLIGLPLMENFGVRWSYMVRIVLSKPHKKE